MRQFVSLRRLAEIRIDRRLIAAPLLGAMGACGFEPLHLWPLMLVALAGLGELVVRDDELHRVVAFVDVDPADVRRRDGVHDEAGEDEGAAGESERQQQEGAGEQIAGALRGDEDEQQGGDHLGHLAPVAQTLRLCRRRNGTKLVTITSGSMTPLYAVGSILVIDPTVNKEALNAGENQYGDRLGGLDLVSWEDWFKEFDGQKLGLLVEEEKPGILDDYYQFVPRDAAVNEA